MLTGWAAKTRPVCISNTVLSDIRKFMMKIFEAKGTHLEVLWFGGTFHALSGRTGCAISATGILCEQVAQDILFTVGSLFCAYSQLSASETRCYLSQRTAARLKPRPCPPPAAFRIPRQLLHQLRLPTSSPVPVGSESESCRRRRHWCCLGFTMAPPTGGQNYFPCRHTSCRWPSHGIL
jgi:hypothetical protein